MPLSRTSLTRPTRRAVLGLTALAGGALTACSVGGAPAVTDGAQGSA